MATQYKFSSGVCTPTHSLVLTVFKNIQREVNRFLDAADRSLLTVDGKLGKKTVDGINMALANSMAFPTVSSCRQVANDPATYYNGLKELADRRKLVAMVMDPESIIRHITNPQPKAQPDGTIVYPSMATAGIGGVPYWAIALAVGGLYYANKKGMI